MTGRYENRENLFASLIADFVRDERGSMIIFSLYMLIAMLMIGGIAFDLMRHENLRVQLQGTTDAATLAAASLSNDQDPNAVVEDYFEKAFGSKSRFLSDVKVTKTTTSRSVTARADATVKTTFMRWSGVDELKLTTLGTAAQEASNVEIAMVLDVSGSMNKFGRIDKLKTAANGFVDIVYADATIKPERRARLSMIPYSDQINFGPTLGPFFNVDNTHANSWCVRVPDRFFSRVSCDRAAVLDRISHYDWETETDTIEYDYKAYNTLPNFQCPVDDTNAVLMMEHDPAKIKKAITALDPKDDGKGFTAISMGAKVGLAMLDSSMGPIVDSMVTSPSSPIPVEAKGFPKPYKPKDPNDPIPNTKIMVIMTDGANTQQHDLPSELKTGMSQVYFSADMLANVVADPSQGGQDAAYAVALSPGRWYYNAGFDHDGLSGTQPVKYWTGDNPLELMGYTDTVQLSNEALLSSRTGAFIGVDIYGADAQGWRTFAKKKNSGPYVGDTRSVYVGTSDLDKQTRRICKAAQTQDNIIIYAIAFEAPQAGKDLMKDCAWPAENYFEVSGDEVSIAFGTIARGITSLKLTQ